MGSVKLTNVTKTFYHRAGNRWVTAISDVSFDLPEGELVCLLGPSGCGKSTILNLVAGFEFPDSGTIELDGEPVTGPGPDRAVVFQEHGLFPWMTVERNVRFGPSARGVKLPRSTVTEVLSLVGMAGFASSYPHELSGGMRQRVALARVLINEPRIMLMDEPLGALDALTRLKMQRLLLDVIAARPTTVLFITHDIDEALALGDRVLVMSPQPGRIVDCFPIEFPKPRGHDVTESPEYLRLRRRITEIIMV